MNQLEIISFNIESCLHAQSNGATRIELCDNPLDGGTTPSYGFIKAAREKLEIDLYAMIRPRGGDFLFSKAEFEIMKTDVQVCKHLGCDGVVIGMLQKDGEVDVERCRILVDLAYPKQVTFHRAFDRVKDSNKALEDVIETGCERILTSGGFPTCVEGAENIKSLVELAGDRIVIMPGSGLNANNILEIAKTTGAKEFHSSAKIFIESEMDFVPTNMQEDLKNISVNGEEVKKMAHLLKSLATF